MIPYLPFSKKMYNTYLNKRYGINTCCNNNKSILELKNDYYVEEYKEQKAKCDIDECCDIELYCNVNYTNKNNKVLHIDVEIGTTQALMVNMKDGDTFYTNTLLKDKDIFFSRNGIILTSYNKMDGSYYYTKSKTSDTIYYSHPLQNGEYIQINTV